MPNPDTKFIVTQMGHVLNCIYCSTAIMYVHFHTMHSLNVLFLLLCRAMQRENVHRRVFLRVKFLLLMVSIFFICWMKRFVLLYFRSIIIMQFKISYLALRMTTETAINIHLCVMHICKHILLSTFHMELNIKWNNRETFLGDRTFKK
jgi:hypothetical protein